MLLAVAGLDKHEIHQHTGALAGVDWSRFSPAEQAAFAFARKHALSPAVAAQDFHDLAGHLGAERALDLIWWTCHCHFMTCVADALQLPLEEGNVFDGFLSVDPGSTTADMP